MKLFSLGVEYDRKLNNLYVKLGKKSYNLYVKLRNFYVKNFFVTILCFKNNDRFIYLDNNYPQIFYRYLLLLIPFYFIKLFANKFNFDIIYKIDGVYGITNIKENHIIPFIKSCVISDDTASLNISLSIRLFNSSIPLHFFMNICELNNYKTIKLIYLNKGVTIEKEIKLNEIDTKKYLIYHLFN